MTEVTDRTLKKLINFASLGKSGPSELCPRLTVRREKVWLWD
jgi:hypothetical protein